ncbi:CHAD domain-containing protein [Paracoccus sp. 1_MG-2023]|uniref:CHAD domain-containing protein n=1 Tax=unclassified Paracoccus (in: a-proteobacteria) TaxID=2688777 RepID=UPI001C096254|nr:MULTISPECIES: CHAD domain-containing protein [unclassified Paracoccus (in: a-proteobacteria)]MBU2958244.1 CHAD domain-containing protein [Paracoccus sp. C2R09]MDO6668371.1 CHAD domain-containing protein [Paracoccus sp. 1_MG-2023]
MGTKAQKLAKSAGLAGDTNALDGFRRLLREDAVIHDRKRAAILTSDDPEAVHQARVALRRMRSLLRGFRDMLSPGTFKALDGLLKARADQLGPLRDADVQAEALGTPQAQSAADDLRAELRATFQAETALSLKIEVERVLHDRNRAIRGDRRRRLADAPLPVIASRALQVAWTELLAFGPDLGRLDPEELHDFRKRSKEMRYLSEFFGRLFDSDAAPMQKRMARMQDALGVVNDLVTMRARGSELPKGADKTEAKARARAAKAWDKLRGAPVWWTDIP